MFSTFFFYHFPSPPSLPCPFLISLSVFLSCFIYKVCSLVSSLIDPLGYLISIKYLCRYSRRTEENCLSFILCEVSLSLVAILNILVVAMPAPLFSKVYMDTMHMPSLSGYKYIAKGHCSIIYWPEWAMLAKENAVALGKWILHDIIYCWGLLLEIITDIGPAFLKAPAYLEKHYQPDNKQPLFNTLETNLSAFHQLGSSAQTHRLQPLLLPQN